jgi:ATP-dependent Zn protease
MTRSQANGVANLPYVKSVELTAYHEAGHAVAAVALGVGAVYASIIPDPVQGTLGHTKHRPWPGPPPDMDWDRVRRHAEPRIILALAGVVAEKRRHGRRHNWVGARTVGGHE